MNGITRRAAAGTLESSDALVEVEPGTRGIEIAIDSVVEKQFGAQILEAAQDTLKEMGVEQIRMKITDRGALDCVIRARVETAVERAREE